MRAVTIPRQSRRHRAAIRRGHRACPWMAHEFEDDEEAIVGPGNDRADAQGQS
jgi:hypothetical protein